jgi:hypothetical protein
MTRRARKVDANQPKLRTLWRSIGGSWLTLVPETGGEPDALIGWRNDDRLIEVKDPDAPASDQQLRPEQADWHRAWKGRPVALVKCFDDMVRLFEP